MRYVVVQYDGKGSPIHFIGAYFWASLPGFLSNFDKPVLEPVRTASLPSSLTEGVDEVVRVNAKGVPTHYYILTV